MAILEGIGHFWLNDKPIPSGHFAPQSAQVATLTVEDNGSTRLDVVGNLGKPSRPLSALTRDGDALGVGIQGLLIQDNQHVLLVGATGNGGSFSTNNISTESYRAEYCLVSDSAFPSEDVGPLWFKSMLVNLNGYEDWLYLRGIKVNSHNEPFAAEYKKPVDRHYTGSFGHLSVTFDLSRPLLATHRSSLTLTETARLQISLPNKVQLKECQQLYQLTEELLILLAASDHNLPWPILGLFDSDQRAIAYFRRLKSSVQPPRAHECLISFPSVAEKFGDIFATYIEKREKFGPGIYLYLGTRRGMRMYIEHRFVNLVWGLEALHRRSGTSTASAGLTAKIARITEQIGHAHDRAWLKQRLKSAHEPPLAKRLLEILSSIPLPLNQEALAQFCERTASLRNDISHYGGMRHEDQKYDDFLMEVGTMSDALAALYHLQILKSIGVTSEQLDLRVNKSHAAITMSRALRQAGLLTADSVV